MKKTFTIGGTEYTVYDCTAIAKDLGESERRKALYVYSISDSGEKDEFVLFGFDMPEDESEFLKMCEDSSAWDGWYETVDSVEIIEELPEEERREISFGKYKNNCQTYNGGTLERI